MRKQKEDWQRCGHGREAVLTIINNINMLLGHSRDKGLVNCKKRISIGNPTL